MAFAGKTVLALAVFASISACGEVIADADPAPIYFLASEPIFSGPEAVLAGGAAY